MNVRFACLTKSIVYPLHAGRQASQGSVRPQKIFYRAERALTVPAARADDSIPPISCLVDVNDRAANDIGVPEMKPQQMYDQIVGRNRSFKWGDSYIPSTLALPREAPKGSRISRLNSRKLGRAIHALSTPERVFTQLALYNPALLDIHEQKMLSPVPTAHPLHGHPLATESFPPPLLGTLAVAQAIGFEHYIIVYVGPDGERKKKPFPYQGDLLLFLTDNFGRPFAVNWSVKDTAEAFSERRSTKAKTPVQRKKDRDYANMRAKLEAEYYASADIRTHQVSLDMLDISVIANLDLLFSMHGLPLTHDPQLMEDFSRDVQRAHAEGSAVAPLAIQYGSRWGCRDQFIARVYQDIWDRKLAVDLFKPILIDHPFNHEEKDLLVACSDLFEGFDV